MTQQKVDYQKINSLKAKVYDQMRLVESNKLSCDEAIRPYQLAIDAAMKEIGEVNKQIEIEENKIKK